MEKRVIEGIGVGPTSEDGGCALITEVCTDDGMDNGLLIRFVSWSETRKHPEWMRAMKGKILRVTIEEVA